MENNELKVILETAREAKGYSKRDLAKRIGLSNTSLNDLENGRVKKMDIDMLRKIAEELDLSLRDLLKAAGYNEVALMFEKGRTKSSKDYEQQLDEYKKSELDLLDWDYQKRRQAAKIAETLVDINGKIATNLDEYGADARKFLEEIYDDLYKTTNLLNPIREKYDYSKLPKEK